MINNIFTRLLNNYKENINEILDFIDKDIIYDKDKYICKFIKLKQLIIFEQYKQSSSQLIYEKKFIVPNPCCII